MLIKKTETAEAEADFNRNFIFIFAIFRFQGTTLNRWVWVLAGCRTPVMGSRRSENRRKWVQEERGRGENTPGENRGEGDGRKKMRGEQREQGERERGKKKNEKSWYFGSCEKKKSINKIIKYIKK